MNSERDILYSHQSVGDYLRSKEARQLAQELPKEEDRPTETKKSETPKNNDTRTISRGDLARRALRREKMIEGDFSDVDCLQADADMRRAMQESYEDECGGKYL